MRIPPDQFSFYYQRDYLIRSNLERFEEPEKIKSRIQPCPHCGHSKTHKHGDRRFKCPACGKTFRLGKLSDVGRPAIGDRPMTGYERLKKHLKKGK